MRCTRFAIFRPSQPPPLLRITRGSPSLESLKLSKPRSTTSRSVLRQSTRSAFGVGGVGTVSSDAIVGYKMHRRCIRDLEKATNTFGIHQPLAADYRGSRPSDQSRGKALTPPNSEKSQAR